MNSTNATITYSVNPETVFQYSCYVVVSSVTVAANLLLIFTVLKTPTLRQRPEVVIFSGLALGNTIDGLGFLHSGLRRLYLILSGPLYTVSAWYCMTVAHTTLIMFGAMTVPFMDLIVSLDRMVCVEGFTSYDRIPTLLYVALMLGIPYTFTAVFSAVGWYVSSRMPTDSVCSVTCTIDFALPVAFNKFMYTVEALFAVCSCVLYLLVMIRFLIKGKQQQETSVNSKVKQSQKIRQAKVTKTLAMVSSATFFLSAVPSLFKGVLQYVSVSSVLISRYTPYLGIINVSNSAVNAIIYISKQKEVRVAVLGLCRARGSVVPVSNANKRSTAVRTSQVSPNQCREGRPV